MQEEAKAMVDQLGCPMLAKCACLRHFLLEMRSIVELWPSCRRSLGFRLPRLALLVVLLASFSVVLSGCFDGANEDVGRGLYYEFDEHAVSGGSPGYVVIKAECFVDSVDASSGSVVVCRMNPAVSERVDVDRIAVDCSGPISSSYVDKISVGEVAFVEFGWPQDSSTEVTGTVMPVEDAQALGLMPSR